jgi:crotonobetaine/carnitine-CoA ligase
VRLAPRFDRRTFWTDVRASAATVFPFVGAMLVLLSKNPRQPDDCANPLRVGYGVPIPANLHRDLEHRFGIRLIHCYGSTEATIVAWGADGDAVPGAAGHTFPGYTVEIRDEEDRELPPTAVGEICVRSDEPCGMFSGYYADPKRTATALRDGWFHTGDRGWKDEQGRLWFAGRIGDSIRCKGENISSYEIEEVFVAHPAVALVAAYGVPSDLGDEDIVLTVVPQPGRQIDPQELLAWSETRLSRYARPRYVDVVDSLPMTPTGKIEKYKLRDRGPSAWAFDSIASPLTAASPVEPHGQRTT